MTVLGLAGTASLVELGPIVMLLYQRSDLSSVLLAGLAYQVGNAAPRPRWLTSRRAALWPLAIAATLGVWIMTPGAPVWLAAIAALSWTLQAVRRSIVASAGGALPTTAQKRTARVVGFIVAGLAPPTIWLGAMLLLMVVAIGSLRPPTLASAPVQWPLKHPLEWAMLTHQLHYFSYALAVLVLVAKPELGGVPFVGFWFACGWVTYLAAETLWRRYDPPRVLVLGHTFLTIVLLGMWFANGAPLAVVALWVLSGLGGGSVYCLTLLHRRAGLSHERLERVEDVGHVLGVGLALICATALKWAASTLPALGALWAAATVVIVIFWVSRRRTSPGSRKDVGRVNCGSTR